ncbi:unnamed protein product [Paramecium sonneborni]|uniref:OTU domain-containing protein n=1 Tax=Paramecium sonneborni TaxID=65129 RepID=A0A8S1QVJ5_9CILI|nr:unnamed protein product [Paramecium sonneborni]
MFEYQTITIRCQRLNHDEQARIFYNELKRRGCREIVNLVTSENIRYQLNLDDNIQNDIIMIPNQHPQIPKIYQKEQAIEQQFHLLNMMINEKCDPYKDSRIAFKSKQSEKKSEQQKNIIEQDYGKNIKNQQKQIPKEVVKNNHFYDQRQQIKQNQSQINQNNQSQNDLLNNLEQKNQLKEYNQQQKVEQLQQSFDSSQFKNQNINNDNSLQEEDKYSNKSQEIFQQQNKHQDFLQKDDERQKKVYAIIKLINAQSSDLRNIDQQFKKYIQDYQDKNELFKEYNIKQIQIKQNLKNICNGFIKVRGDGNCFYTAFGFQFLNHLLITYNDDEFNQFINQIKSIDLRSRININNQQIVQQELEIEILNEFIYQIQQLRIIEDIQERRKQLKSQFSQYELQNDGNGFLYTLSTIFFRNLSDYLIENNHNMKQLVEDKQNLLIWEQECDNNEVIINELAQYLKINVILIFFDQGNYKIRKYQENNQNQIILLIRPGQYNIGLYLDL